MSQNESSSLFSPLLQPHLFLIYDDWWVIQVHYSPSANYFRLQPSVGTSAEIFTLDDYN